jgi:hypothetical protein
VAGLMCGERRDQSSYVDLHTFQQMSARRCFDDGFLSSITFALLTKRHWFCFMTSDVQRQSPNVIPH